MGSISGSANLLLQMPSKTWLSGVGSISGSANLIAPGAFADVLSGVGSISGSANLNVARWMPIFAVGCGFHFGFS